MEGRSPRPCAKSNIFDQFDVEVAGELLPGGAPKVDGYFCRLPPCLEEKRVFNKRIALVKHRVQGHSAPHAGVYKIPEEDQIRQWLSSGKPRPYEIPQRSPERTKSPDRPDHPPGSSLLTRLLHCKPDTESELQPASLRSNIYEQFNVRHEPGVAGESPYVGYACLLSQCHQEKVCLNTHRNWLKHRRIVHDETEEVQSVRIPNVCQIREWVNLNKPRPYEVPRKSKPWKMKKTCPVDPDVFAEFDVKGTVEEIKQLQFFCLLDTCKELGVSFQGRRKWRKHRIKDHMSPKYKGGEFTLPSEDTLKDWMKAGKPPHYKPRKRVRTTITIDPSSETSTELHNREVDPTPSEVGSENLRKLLSQEGRPSLRRFKSLARLGKLRPSTHPDEIPRESRRRGRRPRNADAVGCSSDTEPAHQKKKRRSIHSTNRSGSTAGVITESDSSGVVAIEVVAHGEDPTRSLRKQFMEKSNPTCHETLPSHDSDEECDEVNEDVDEETEDGSENVDDHDHNSADTEEFGEEPHEDFAGPEYALPSLPYSQPELHDSGVAEMAEDDEDDQEEFEAPDTVLPSHCDSQIVTVVEHSRAQSQDFQGVTDEHLQNSSKEDKPDAAEEMTKAGEEASEEFEVPDAVLPLQQEMQNIKVVCHSSVQSQDFQGVTDEHHQNSTAEMADADEEAPKDYAASENILPSLQNSSTEDKPDCDVIPVEISEVEEELEDCVAPENALSALACSQGDILETLPDSTAVMDEVEEGAPEDSVEMDEVEEETPEDSAEMDEVEEETPEDSAEMDEVEEETPENSAEMDEVEEETPKDAAEMDEVEEETPEDSAAVENVLPSLSCLQPEFGVTGIVEHDNVWPQEIPGEILAAEKPEVGEKAAEEIVAVGNLSLPVQSKSSKQNALSTLGHSNFRDTLQFSLEDAPGETGNHRPNSDAEMAEVGGEALEGFVAPGNFVPRIPLMQSERTKVPSLRGPIDNQAPIQESAPRFKMDQVFIFGPNAAGMAEVGGEAPEGFVAQEKMSPWIMFMKSEGTRLPSLEGPIDIRAAPIRVHMDPVFIEESSAARVSEVTLEETLEFVGAPGNLVNLPDYSNTENEPIIQQFLWNTDVIHSDIAFMNELAAAVPFAPSTQPEVEIRRIYMDGRDEDSTENQVDPIQEPRRELNSLIDLDRAFELELDPPVIDDRDIEDPEEFFHLQALALARSYQPMHQVFNPGNSESSYNVPAIPALPTDSLDIDMSAGLDYELRMLLDEIPAWLCNE